MIVNEPSNRIEVPGLARLARLRALRERIDQLSSQLWEQADCSGDVDVMVHPGGSDATGGTSIAHSLGSESGRLFVFEDTQGKAWAVFRCLDTERAVVRQIHLEDSDADLIGQCLELLSGRLHRLRWQSVPARIQ